MSTSTLADLQTYLQTYAAQNDNTVVLDATFLSPSAVALIDPSLGLTTSAITLQNVPPSAITLNAGKTTLLILGGRTTSDGILSLTNVPASVAITQTTPNSPTGYDVLLQLVTPGGWTFGDSYPALALAQLDGDLDIVQGPFLYFSSYAAAQTVPAFPTGPTSPPAGALLQQGLNYFADVAVGGIYTILASVVGTGTFPMYGLIKNDPTNTDAPTNFDLHAPLTQSSIKLGFLELPSPWLGVRVTYPTAPADGSDTAYDETGDDAGAASTDTSSDDAVAPILFYYVGTMPELKTSVGGTLGIEFDVSVANVASTQVTVAVDTADSTTLNLDSIAAALMNSSASAIQAATGPLSTYLGTITLSRFNATFVPLPSPALTSAQLTLTTAPPWPIPVPNTPQLTLTLNWQILFMSPKDLWSVSFTAYLQYDPKLSFDVTVSIDQDDNLRLSGAEHGSISLGLSDVNSIFKTNLPIPDDLATMTLTNFMVDIDVTGKKTAVSGQVDASFALFGTQILALKDMQIALTVDASKTTTEYTFSFNGIIALGPIEVSTTATISNVATTDTIFTMHLVNETVGSMLNHLVHLVDPTYDVSFGDPWDKILDISLDALVLTVNVTKKSVNLTYTTDVDLGFISITGITLTYVASTATAPSKTTIGLDGTFFGQQFGAGSSNAPLAWDAVNDNPPSLPSGGSSLFDLQYAGLGQHIAFTGSDLTTVEDVMKALQASVLPSQAGALPAFGTNSLSFSAQSNWLIGAEFTVMGTLSISAIFNDPNLYGILIQLSGDKAKIFKGLKFEILYRKVTETIGVYHIELQLPDAMRHLEFGEVSITLPNVILDIYTNGNFRVDFGFPTGLDFSASFSIQVFPFVGYGGFYFALLDGATSSRVPAITNGTWSPVIEFGIALSLGVGKTIDEGILSGGISVTVVGILQGVLGWFHPTDSSPSETYYWIQGSISIVGKLYATIDFGIISASLNVTAYATVTLTIESHQPIYIAISAGVSVSVSVKIVFFTIHLSFHANVDASFTIGSASPTPWKLAPAGGSTQSLAAPSAYAMAMAAPFSTATGAPRLGRTLSAPPYRPARYRRAVRRGMRAATPSPTALLAASTAWPAVSVLLNGPQSAALWAVPAFTKSETVAGGANAIILLAAENSIDPNASTLAAHATLYGSNASTVTFNLLMQAMLGWGIYVHTGQTGSSLPASTVVTAGQLDDLVKQFSNPATSLAAFDYNDVVNFLAANFTFTVTPSADTSAGAALFPMFPTITLTDTAGVNVNFATYNTVDSSYQQQVTQYFAQMQVQYAARNGSGAAAAPTGTSYSVAELIFTQYFTMLLSSAAKSASDLLTQYPYTTPSIMSIAQVATAVGDAGINEDPMRVVAPNQTNGSLLQVGAVFSFPHVGYQIRANDTLTSVAAAYAALGALDSGGAAYTVTDLVTANTGATGIFNLGETATFTGISYTTVAGDTLNLIATRLLLRAGGPTLLGGILNLSDTVSQLLTLNPAITDPNAPIDPGTTPTLKLAGGGTYTVVAGDTLTLVAGYGLALAQGVVDVGTFITTLLKNNTLSVTDPTAVQPTGTQIAIPPLARTLAANDSIGSLATLLTTTVPVVQATLATVPLAPHGVLAVPLGYAVAPVPNTSVNDSFGSIAGKFGLSLQDVATSAASVTNLFASGQTLIVDDLASITVGALMPALLNLAEWNNASGMVSRFLLSGLRLPEPSDASLVNLVAGATDFTALSAIATAPLFALTGQQYAIAAAPGAGYEITLTANGTVPPVTLGNGSSVSFGLTQNELALLATIAATPLDAPTAKPTRLALYQMTPPRTQLQNHITWQIAKLPASGPLASTNGNPSIWLFPDGLITQLESLGAQNTGALLYELVVMQQGAADTATTAPQVNPYAWAAIVDFTISLSVTDGSSPGVANAYVVGGADDAGAALLMDIYDALPSDGSGASLYLLYAPNPSGGSPSGLVSDQLNSAATNLLKTNLSTLTHSSALFAADLQQGAQVTDPTSVYASPLSAANQFVALLWEASVTRSGGFYLNYVAQNGGAALPPSVFGNGSTATLSLLVLLDAQAASIDAPIQPFNNCVVVGQSIDTSSSSLLVQPALYTTVAGETLTSAAQAINTEWGTTLAPGDVAAANASVPQLLLVGASLTIPISGTAYPVAYGDTLASIATHFGTTVAALVGAGSNATAPILATGSPVQLAQGVLQPATTVPPGTIGFELTRVNPDPNNVPYDQLTPGQTVDALFNLVGYSIAGSSLFNASGEGLPTTPAQSLPGGAAPSDAPEPFWYYAQALAVAPFATVANGSASAALPLATANPYNGVGAAGGSVNTVTLDLELHDVYGNSQPFPAGYASLDVPVGYYDNVAGLASWPSLSVSYQVAGATPAIALGMTMQQARYVPSPSVTVSSALAAIAADLTTYTTVYYQFVQPDLTFSLQTTLDQRSMGAATPVYPLSPTPFFAFAYGAYLYLAAFATMTQVKIATTSGTVTIGTLSAQYGVTPQQLIEENQAQMYEALFGTASLTIPTMYTAVAGDTLASIVANPKAPPGLTVGTLATLNANVPLDPGTDLAATARTATAALTDTLANIATREHASAAAIAQANPTTTLQPKLTLALGIMSYVTGSTDNFTTVAKALLGTIAAVAVANENVPGLFADNTALAVTDVLSADGDTLASLANAYGSANLGTFASNNETVPNVFGAGTAVQVGSTTATGAAGDSITSFAKDNNVTVDQLAIANAVSGSTPFAASAVLAIPEVLANTSTAQYATYSAVATDTLTKIASKFAIDAAALVALNVDIPGLLATGQPVNDTTSGKSVNTAAGDSFATIVTRFAGIGVTVTPAQLAADCATQQNLVAVGGLWIAPPMLGDANGNADGTLQGLATAYNTDVPTLATANAANLGFLAAGVSLTVGSTTYTTTQYDTLNALVTRFAAADVPTVATAIAAVPKLIAPAALVAPIPPPSPPNNGTAISPSFSATTFPITVNVIAARNPAWIDPDFTGAPAVAAATSVVIPQPDAQGAAGTPLALTAFANALQSSLPGLYVATGDNQDAAGQATTTVWGVNFGSTFGPQINFSFQGAQTQYFAVPPVSTSLVGGAASVIPYVSGKGLTGAAQSQTFGAVDLDVWLSTFLSAYDTFLSVAYAVPAYAIDPTDVVDVVTAKQTIANAISARTAYVLQNASGGSPSDAVGAIYQSMLEQLSTAFSTDTIVQVPVAVTSPFTDPLSAPRLSGKIVLDTSGGAQTGLPDAYSFTPAKVSLVNGTPTASFLFSVKTPAAHRVATLTIDYSITELELPDPNSTIGSYEGSSWLTFITPVAASATTASKIGRIDIPIPLRAYPSPVTLVGQSALQTVAQPATPADLLGWNAGFVYTHDDAEQDVPTVSVSFNVPPTAKMSTTTAESAATIQSVFASLAQFSWVWPALKDDLALLPTLPPVPAGGTPNPVALNAVKAFAQIVGGVAGAWASMLTADLEEATPPLEIFTYQMEKGYSVDETTLATLTITSVDPTTFQPLANPIVLWPAVTAWAGATPVLLTQSSTTSTQAVYAYPAGQFDAATPVPQTFVFTWPNGTSSPPTPPSTSVAAPQSFAFDDVNVLGQQNLLCGVSIARNLVLVPNTTTNTAFVYQTPMANFPGVAIPSVEAVAPIPIGSAPTGIAVALGAFFDTVLTPALSWLAGGTIQIRLAGAYTYELAGGGTGDIAQLTASVPIVLVPSYEFDPPSDWDATNAGSFVSQVETYIVAWQKANVPTETGGSYTFDLTVYASPNLQGLLQPLIRAMQLTYSLTAP